MKNIICKAFWGKGDRDSVDNNGFFFSRNTGVNVSLLLCDEFKAKKIVVLEYKYNILLTILFNINSWLLLSSKIRIPYP